MRRLSLVAESGGYTLAAGLGLLVTVVWLMGSRARVSSSSWTRDRTSVHCIARQILNHWTTRDAPEKAFFKSRCEV